ncbi:MAG TPA: hypothetical protein VK469_06215, partial [Candidatus Kapabacteria bacterium]|nr:hypothetical protein [Candidatus Kapabacteria bacterium]
MSKFKAFQGILALVDMVNFTNQAAQTGETQAHFQEKVKSITGKYGFKVVKSLGDGDALLVFGTDPEGFLDIVLDLFHYQEQGDLTGFKPKFRLVAHSGFFQFQVEDGNPVNLANPMDINPFRKNKTIQSWELAITHPLYQGLKFLATGKNIQATRLVLNKPVKGFDGEEWIPPFYKLKIEKAQRGAANLLERRMNELENDVQRIPVFGDIYPSVPMNKNFINLSMTHDAQQPRKRIGRQPIDSNEFDKESYLQANTIDVPAFYKQHHRAIIFGLPGAGKTTILRYLASQIFKNNENKPDNKKQIILFAPCRETLFYDEWYKDKHGT